MTHRHLLLLLDSSENAFQFFDVDVGDSLVGSSGSVFVRMDEITWAEFFEFCKVSLGVVQAGVLIYIYNVEIPHRCDCLIGFHGKVTAQCSAVLGEVPSIRERSAGKVVSDDDLDVWIYPAALFYDE